MSERIVERLEWIMVAVGVLLLVIITRYNTELVSFVRGGI